MRLNVESRTSFSGRGAAGLKFWGDSSLLSVDVIMI